MANFDGNVGVTSELGKNYSISRRLIPLPDWPMHHSWPPVGGLRHLVFNSKSNGFDRVIRRVGRRVLIDENAFFEWVDAQKEGAHV